MGKTMKQRTAPVLIIGHDLLALGLAASLRTRGRWVLVRGAALAERDTLSSVVAGPTPAAIIIDLLIARSNDFAVLRAVRQQPHLRGIPILVLSPGTIGQECGALEGQLRALGARPLLNPHDLDEVVGELNRSLISVA
jgi:CheY-like chemotaxis protein